MSKESTLNLLSSPLPFPCRSPAVPCLLGGPRARICSPRFVRISFYLKLLSHTAVYKPSLPLADWDRGRGYRPDGEEGSLKEKNECRCLTCLTANARGPPSSCTMPWEQGS